MNNEELEIENHLKDLRKERKLSQEELADSLGISRQSIIALEQGKYLPSLPLVVNLCKFFQSPFEDIFVFELEIEDEIVNIVEDNQIHEAVSFHNAMDKIFDDSAAPPKSAGAMPRIDIKDKKDAIVVKAELPGMAEEDIEVEIADGIMTISGEKKEEKEEEGYYYKESHTGAFSRSFTLPADVKEEKAEAEMKKGVLSITIPKIEAKKATKVKIAPKK